VLLVLDEQDVDGGDVARDARALFSSARAPGGRADLRNWLSRSPEYCSTGSFAGPSAAFALVLEGDGERVADGLLARMSRGRASRKVHEDVWMAS